MYQENQNSEGLNFKEIKELMIQAFEKARFESKKTSNLGLYKYISDSLNYKPAPNEKTFDRYYKKYIEGDLTATGQPKEDIIDEISIWLGYENFANFCHENFQEDEVNLSEEIPINEEKKEENKIIGQSGFLRSNIGQKSYLKGGVTGLGIAAIIGFSSYLGINGETSSECMYWKGTHYEMIECNKAINPNIDIKPYNESQFKHFKKVTPTDTTTFFRAGIPVVWYVKIDGEPEFYSTDGKHPINGRELKRVTPYIVDKYVFNK